MDKEIKEILEELKRRNELFNNLEGDVEISPIEYYEAHLLLDYITNLQQQNKELLKKSYSDDVKITKASEYIKNIERLTNNWNELEEWLKVNDKYSQGYFKQVLDYMDVIEEKKR